jgi:hypothetical protein
MLLHLPSSNGSSTTTMNPPIRCGLDCASIAARLRLSAHRECLIPRHSASADRQICAAPKPRRTAGRVIPVATSDREARLLWAAQVSFVLGHLPVDLQTGKPTTKGISNRELRLLFDLAEVEQRRQLRRQSYSASKRLAPRRDVDQDGLPTIPTPLRRASA